MILESCFCTGYTTTNCTKVMWPLLRFPKIVSAYLESHGCFLILEHLRTFYTASSVMLRKLIERWERSFLVPYFFASVTTENTDCDGTCYTVWELTSEPARLIYEATIASVNCFFLCTVQRLVNATETLTVNLPRHAIHFYTWDCFASGSYN